MPFPSEHTAILKSPTLEKTRESRTRGSGKGAVQGVKVPTSISIRWLIQTKEEKENPRNLYDSRSNAGLPTPRKNGYQIIKLNT